MPKWSSKEKERLALLWSELEMPGLVKAFPGRTEGAIRRQAFILGLSGLAPQGLESIKASAIRTGFCYQTLVSILKWARVTIQNSRAIARKRGTQYRCRFVNIYDVDEALERWHLAMDSNEAADFLGVSRGIMQSMLSFGRAMQVPAPEGMRKDERGRPRDTMPFLPHDMRAGKKWRLMPEVLTELHGMWKAHCERSAARKVERFRALGLAMKGVSTHARKKAVARDDASV